MTITKFFREMIGLQKIMILLCINLLNFCSSAQKTLVSDRLENVTQTISRILEGYDIRLRPNFGGKWIKGILLFHVVLDEGFSQKLPEYVSVGINPIQSSQLY